MKTAVVVAVHNEQEHIVELIEALLRQTFLPDEIIFVDDGSSDDTASIIKQYSEKHPLIRYVWQENSGPATARNKGWQIADSEICVFTDGDCVPKNDWLAKLISPLRDASIGATGGSYETLNSHNRLAKFIGLEIDLKYSSVNGEISAHGTYNLAVRKSVLRDVKGFDEGFRYASGEDWDLTYKISRKYKIIFVPDAVVGHYHPENLRRYLRNQVVKACDRMKLYKDHPDKKQGDNYTSRLVAYQIFGSAMFLMSTFLLFPVFNYSFLIPVLILGFLVLSASVSFPFYYSRDPSVALYAVKIQFLRNFAWLLGVVKGIKKYGI